MVCVNKLLHVLQGIYAVESFVILLLILIIIDMSGNMRIMGIFQLGTLASSSFNLFSLSLRIYFILFFFFVLYNRRWFNIHLFIQAYILMYFVVAFLVIWAAAAAVRVCLLLLWCHTHNNPKSSNRMWAMAMILNFDFVFESKTNS